MRPCEGDIANARASDFASSGGSNLCAGVNDRGESVPVDKCPGFLDSLPYDLLLLLGEIERSIGSSTGFSGCEVSRDMPGICTRVEFDP